MNQAPKVRFIPVSLSREVDLITYFLEESWAKYIIKRHPDLKNASKEQNVQNRFAMVKAYTQSFRRLHKTEIEHAQNSLRQNWQPTETKIFEILQLLIGTSWPPKKKNIDAFVSINPICPRFLSSWSFALYFKSKNPQTTRRICTHEIAHFLHFKKWAEIFKDTNPEQYEAPHKPWLLSELAAVCVINDPRLQPLIGMKEKPYPEHKNIKISGTPVTEIISKIYKKTMFPDPNYTTFLTEAANALKMKDLDL